MADSLTRSGKEFQMLTTRMEKELALCSLLALFSTRLYGEKLSLVLTVATLFTVQPSKPGYLSDVIMSMEDFPCLDHVLTAFPFLQSGQTNLSQPLHIGTRGQPGGHPDNPLLDVFQQINVLLVLRSPDLDTVLQMWTDIDLVEPDPVELVPVCEGPGHLPN